MSEPVITNVGIRSTLPLRICLICITPMRLEAALGVCVGCEFHGFMVRRGGAGKDSAYEVCAHGARGVTPRS
ncbi:MAG: hypothetical protein HY855_05045 [Burkholderiales bacterium]|nr:hypothetical protein [Burkholderiales bacterium]